MGPILCSAGHFFVFPQDHALIEQFLSELFQLSQTLCGIVQKCSSQFLSFQNFPEGNSTQESKHTLGFHTNTSPLRRVWLIPYFSWEGLLQVWNIFCKNTFDWISCSHSTLLEPIFHKHLKIFLAINNGAKNSRKPQILFHHMKRVGVFLQADSLQTGKVDFWQNRCTSYEKKNLWNELSNYTGRINVKFKSTHVTS